MTLTEFLLERIADDEQVAMAWGSSGPSRHLRDETRPPYLDPARVLAECEAKRRIVAECGDVLAVTGWDYDDAPKLAEFALIALALPYADHEDFDPTWRTP